MPSGALTSRVVLASHVARKAWARVWRGEASPGRSLVRLLADAVALETTRFTFGTQSMIRGAHGLFPHVFLPDYQGPCFDEAVLRLLEPGRGPNVLYYSLTGTCPCRCEYCFAGAEPTGRDLGDAVVLEVARAVALARIPLVNISGGEPFVHYDRLREAVRILSSGCEVRVFTTGFGMSGPRLRELRDAGLKGLFVSLDTEDAAHFDRTRGRVGAFDAAVRALRIAADENVLTFINSVVDRRRFPDRESVARFLRFVERIDPRIVVNFLPQLAAGRGVDADSFRAPHECEPTADLIVSTAREFGRPVCMLFGRVDTFIGCVGAGGRLMNVDIAGNVTVCISRAAIGNVLEEPFAAIYDRFRQSCTRLKVGFFCCVAGEGGEREVLPFESSLALLSRFYANTDDAEWQRVRERVGPFLARAYTPPRAT
jgi:MoaA/NifB/PqqE/SkfB family radical SAM enzyme